MQMLEHQRQDGFRRVVRALRTQDDVRKLEDRIEQLEAENAYLREQISAPPESCLPHEWKLTKSEGVFFVVLLRLPVATYDALLTALYYMRDVNEAEMKIIQVFAHRVRRKLAPHGIQIKTLWGRGYYLEATERQHLRAQLMGSAG